VVAHADHTARAQDETESHEPSITHR
jgi:hypothetical protein